MVLFFSLAMSSHFPRNARREFNIELEIFTDILHSNSCNGKK